LIKPGQTYFGKQGITYGAGASAETVGAEKICKNVMPMPPGAIARVACRCSSSIESEAATL
jgi:uncharacterized RmlC-like cupin family protein